MVGEGGGCCSSSSARLPRCGASEKEADPRECLCADFPLAEDLTDCESVLSTLVVDASPGRCVLDARGLSEELLPGILGIVRNAVLKERDDSLVSDLLNDGYESRLGPVGVEEPLLLALPSLSFDGWLPMLAM